MRGKTMVQTYRDVAIELRPVASMYVLNSDINRSRLFAVALQQATAVPLVGE
jgi:hypothetical protein